MMRWACEHHWECRKLAEKKVWGLFLSLSYSLWNLHFFFDFKFKYENYEMMVKKREIYFLNNLNFIEIKAYKAKLCTSYETIGCQCYFFIVDK